MGLFGLDATGLDLLRKQPVSLGQTGLQRFGSNIPHQRRDPTHRTGIGDAAAHDARAEHSGLAKRPCLLDVAASLFLQELVVDEESHQCGRSVSLAKTRKHARFIR